MGGGEPTKNANEQEERIQAEATRIQKIVKLAAPYHCDVHLYNHNGWFGQTDNQIAVIKKLGNVAITHVGMIYNFSHGHQDVEHFAAIWQRMQPYVVAVNITGMEQGGEERIIPPAQGTDELAMLSVIQASGWRGPIGLIAEQGGDAEITLGNGLRGVSWLRLELAMPGSGGDRPTPR